ncbi:MAG: cob(I)yrinic acid a,c-diamide adenosyltransferase [Bacteroidaceae bacterium]|nr:cob(I)yrinic acid a,c-diamide adenosyltransferase [Bacteroidaceae bacterium]
MKIYTKTGDKGTTSLVGGARVAKTHVRLEAYGTLDELNAHLGLLSTCLSDAADVADVRKMQNLLFVAGTLLATEEESPCWDKLPHVTDADVAHIEQLIDALQESLPPLRAFVLPGGTRASAQAHVCRTVCRRAERRVLAMAEAGIRVEEQIIALLNRMSDYLFVLSRKTNHLADCDEIFYNNACD